MARGRKREFDREEVLTLAMQHFWVNGYEGSGLTDLLDAVGIARQSLYSTFGNKHELFLEALDHFFVAEVEPKLRQLDGEHAGFQALTQFFESLGKKGFGNFKLGCMLTNAITELAPGDSQVAKIAKQQLDRIEKAFQASVVAAQKAGNLRKDLKPNQVARLLLGTMHGVMVLAKTPSGKSKTKDIVSATLSVLT